jgi:uncharacterized protein with FMN-binding domain
MRRVVLAIVSTVASLVLLLSFKTHGTSVATPPAASSSASGSTAATGSTTTSGASGTSGSTGGSTGTKTVTGTAADTRYGPVQVRITVTNGKVTSAQAVDYPQNDPRDQQINAYAVPALNQEAVQAGTASIDMISGATYTSQGYIQSLQSALDKAKA